MAITTSRDKVRLEIADTDSSAQLLQDDEIDYIITQESTLYGAAARCCEIISRNFLRKADVRIGRGGTTLTYSTAAKQYAEMATAFRKRAIGMNAPWAGGTSVDDKETLASDPSKVQPLFTKTSMNSPFVNQGNDSLLSDQD